MSFNLKGIDLLEPLFRTLTIIQQDRLLAGYVDAITEGARFQAADGSEKETAINAMLDNAADSQEVLAEHIGYCLVCLVSTGHKYPPRLWG